MEDILASIRKIISDDEPVAMESPEDMPTADLVETSAAAGLNDMMKGIHFESNDLTSDAVLDAVSGDAESLLDEGDSVDLNIDDVLAGLDDDILGADVDDISLESAAFEDNALTDLVSSEIAPDTDEDILSFLDADIPLTDAQPEATGLEIGAGDVGVDLAADEDLEMDSLLDDILMSPIADDARVTLDDAIIETDVSAEDTTSAEDTDLELVKSLMADLADDPAGLETDEDLDALLAIPDVEDEPAIDDDFAALLNDIDVPEVNAPEVDMPESDALEADLASADSETDEDILGDILDMTLEDELLTHPDDLEADDLEADDLELDDLTSLDAVAEAEQDNVAENIDFEDELPSLSEIAAAAEADAVAVETVAASAPQAAIATAGLAAAAVGGAALGSAASDDVEAEAETDDTPIDIETTPEPISMIEETSMPVKAVQTDAILNEVTETAAAGAFAELNQVVEDQAVFNESGPRIGDLVQDALRPMLKEWLDANLKGIVERAVTKEVKRISSGK